MGVGRESKQKETRKLRERNTRDGKKNKQGNEEIDGCIRTEVKWKGWVEKQRKDGGKRRDKADEEKRRGEVRRGRKRRRFKVKEKRSQDKGQKR